MWFQSSVKYHAANLAAMRTAEADLMHFAKAFGDRDPNSYELRSMDTSIDASVLPMAKHAKLDQTTMALQEPDLACSLGSSYLTMHSIYMRSLHNKNNTTEMNSTTTKTPLVLIHGYMTASMYWYRTFVNLTHYYQSVHAVDMMGWGLSSRPEFKLVDQSVETAEDFFVETLEAWRSANKIEKMYLAAHSFGGYLSVAYCERYPKRVERLILLSPLGLAEHKEEGSTEGGTKQVFKSHLFRLLLQKFYKHCLYNNGYSLATLVRAVPRCVAQGWITTYFSKRVPCIPEDSTEQQALVKYCLANMLLPASGELGLHPLISSDAVATKPLLHRIPRLEVRNVSFIYGEHCWMNQTNSLHVQRMCDERREREQASPHVTIYNIQNAGHLLMVENGRGCSAAIVVAGGGQDSLPPGSPTPRIRTCPIYS